MNALVFLGIAVGLSLAGCGVLWLRSRQPGSMDAHIRDFARELDALAPGSPLGRQRSRPGQREERGPKPELPFERGIRTERPDQATGREGPPRRGNEPERPPRGRGPGTGPPSG